MTNSQINGVCNARDAKNKLASILDGLVNDINASMALPWSGDSEHESAFFDALGNQAAEAWQKNGILINAALTMGANYADIAKPDRICVVCADGHVVPTDAPFPPTPLAIWHIPAATKADGLVIDAGDNASILAALIAAQPSA